MAEIEQFSEELLGEKLKLKQIKPDSIPDRYLTFMQDPDVIYYLQARFQEHTQESLTQFVAGFDHVDHFLFGVYTQSEDEFIGTGTLRVNPVHRYSTLVI